MLCGKDDKKMMKEFSSLLACIHSLQLYTVNDTIFPIEVTDHIECDDEDCPTAASFEFNTFERVSQCEDNAPCNWFIYRAHPHAQARSHNSEARMPYVA